MENQLIVDDCTKHRLDSETEVSTAPNTTDSGETNSSETTQTPLHWAGTTTQKLGWNLYAGDALQTLKTFADEQFDCVVTSPPYFWLRDYGVEGQLGKEPKIADYVQAITAVMNETKRVLSKDGVLFLNIGDTYYSGKGEAQGIDKKSRKRRFGLRAVDASGLGVPQKSLIGIPWRVALSMIDNDWVLRSSIIWDRAKALPESVKDRPKRNYEYVFMFVKSRKYYFNKEALGTQKQDIWTISARPKPTTGISTAPFPDELAQKCIDIGCPPQGHVLDPFAGSGTVLRVALKADRHATGIELNPAFCDFIVKNLKEL